MAIKYAHDAAGLLRVLQTVRDGDVIKLEAGTYGSINLKNFKFTDVTIESKDATKPALLTELIVRDSSGFTFRNLEFFVDPTKPVRPFQVIESKDIHFEGLNVHGRLDGNPADEKAGLIIRNSVDISVTRSEFHQLEHGIEHLDSQKLTITGNSFHDIRTDGVRGGGTSDVLIARNLFKDFYPAAGDHGDAIQFWTTNTSASAKNIVIDENVILRGAGGIVQGIFFRDQLDKLPYQNVTITDNLVVGAMFNGIYVDGVNKLKIKGNVVQSTPDQKSWIRVDNGKSTEIADNVALQFLQEGREGTPAKNKVNAAVHDGGKAAFSAWTAKFGEVGLKAEKATPTEPGSSQGSAQDLLQLTGTPGKDKLVAADPFKGTSLSGGAGNDQLVGGKHGDFLIGGLGNDVMTGGAGADQFRFFGTQIDGPSDRDRITDLNFGEGDLIVFGSFGKNTFTDAAGINAYSGGTAAAISSFDGIVKAAAGSSKITAFREQPGSANLVLRVVDVDGQAQEIVIQNGYAQYLAAGGSDGL